MRALVAALALLLSGCSYLVLGEPASAALERLSRDRASACLTLRSTLYGTATLCRTGAARAVLMADGQGALRMQHAE